jgi:hypothetical protein
MNPDRLVDRTIRNQRSPGSPAWVWLSVCGLFWIVVGIVIDMSTPPQRNGLVSLCVAPVMLGSLLAVLLHLDRRPVYRIRLGEEFRAYPSGRFPPAEIRAIQIAHDPDEDYVEGKLPVRLCLVTVEPRRGRTIRLIASAIDAARLREWAMEKSVPLNDPEGYTTPSARASSIEQVSRQVGG